MCDYVLYKDGEFCDVGSKKRLAAYLNCAIATISFYMTPTYKCRCKIINYEVFKVEDEPKFIDQELKHYKNVEFR